MLTRNNDQWRPVSCVPGLAAGAGAGGAGGAGGEAQGVGGDVVVDVDIAQQLACCDNNIIYTNHKQV